MSDSESWNPPALEPPYEDDPPDEPLDELSDASEPPLEAASPELAAPLDDVPDEPPLWLPPQAARDNEIVIARRGVVRFTSTTLTRALGGHAIRSAIRSEIRSEIRPAIRSAIRSEIRPALGALAIHGATRGD